MLVFHHLLVQVFEIILRKALMRRLLFVKVPSEWEGENRWIKSVIDCNNVRRCCW